jgi:DNA primase large subunit
MSVELPDWYILKDPGDTTLDVESWYKYANTRLERFLSEDLWIIQKPSWMTDEEWIETKIQEIGGHLLLRLAVAKDPRLTSWLVEVEGDLFEFRFVSSINFEDKIQVLMDLYGKTNVKTIDEIDDIFGIEIYRKFNIADIPPRKRRYTSTKFGGKVKDLDKRVAIKFFKIPSVISAKKALMYQGWAIVRLADIRLAVKRKFESDLKEIIEKSKMILDKDSSLDATVKPIKDQIDEIARSVRLSGDITRLGIDAGEEIFTKPETFPPCIRELVAVLQAKGHLSHVENWQLGTYLKRVGMSIEEQYAFWYRNSVDNVGMSFDEFKNRVGYQIRHIYGKEGGGIDYSPPSCKTCIEGYFCYWAHKKLEDLSEDIRVTFADRNSEAIEKAIEEISRLIINQRFQSACARYFNLLTGWRMGGNKVNHMVNYSKQVYKRFHSQKPKEEKKKTENTEEGQEDE